MFVSGNCVAVLMCMCIHVSVLQYCHWFWGKPQHQHQGVIETHEAVYWGAFAKFG